MNIIKTIALAIIAISLAVIALVYRAEHHANPCSDAAAHLLEAGDDKDSPRWAGLIAATHSERLAMGDKFRPAYASCLYARAKAGGK